VGFNFDEIVQRRGSGSYKWDTADDASVLPMWVADMDFRTAPAVIAALERRVKHGIFGYTKIEDAYFDALTAWYSRRHHAAIEREWILYTSGVVPALSAIIRAHTEPGDCVIVQPPVYNCFYSSIRNMGCQVVENNLLYRDGRYEMDFDDLEKKVVTSKARLFLLCSPHNPVGRVWARGELIRLGEICFRHGVTVVSDEIHCDLVLPANTHIPFFTLGPEFLQNSVTCSSPSKAFNLAGLQIANIVSADDEVRCRIDKVLNIHEVCDVNPFGVEALIAAYTKGEPWLDALNRYISGNVAILRSFIREQLPFLTVVPQEATYLAWIDCKKLKFPSKEIAQRLLSGGKVWVNEGTLYGESGEGFVRINIACPAAILVDGLMRISRAILGWAS